MHPSLQACFHLALPPTLAYDYPTPASLATLIHTQLQQQQRQPARGDRSKPELQNRKSLLTQRQLLSSAGMYPPGSADVGVVAISVAVPGGGSGPGQCIDAVGPVPFQRWAVEDQNMHDALAAGAVR